MRSNQSVTCDPATTNKVDARKWDGYTAARRRRVTLASPTRRWYLVSVCRGATLALHRHAIHPSGQLDPTLPRSHNIYYDMGGNAGEANVGTPCARDPLMRGDVHRNHWETGNTIISRT